MKLSRRKLRQLIAESLNEMSSPMAPMSLDSLKPMMDQNEYEIVSNNIRIKDTYLGQLVISKPRIVLFGGLFVVFISMIGVWFVNVEVNVIKEHYFNIFFKIPLEPPLVTIIIPTKDNLAGEYKPKRCSCSKATHEVMITIEA